MEAPEGDLDVQELVLLMQDLGINRMPRHGEIIGLRMNVGEWGFGDRYNVVQIVLQDDDGTPLEVPRWTAVNRPANPYGLLTLSGTQGELELAFNGIGPAEGALRFGPLSNGQWIPDCPFCQGFLPLTQAEMLYMQPIELRDTVEIQGEIQLQMLEYIEILEAENRALRRGLHMPDADRSRSHRPQNIEFGRPQDSSTPRRRGASVERPPWASTNPFLEDQPGPSNSRPSSPILPGICIATPRIPPQAQPNNVSLRGPVGPISQPDAGAPPAPASVSVPQPVVHYVPVPAPAPAIPPPAPTAVIPIQHIRAVTGPTPTNPREIPMWLGRHAPAIEGVFPITDQETRARVCNALIGGQAGLTLTGPEANDWATVVAVLFTRTHGAYPLHQLGQILKDIASQEGINTAYRLGMMMANGDFDLVWGILRAYVPGQAAVTAITQRLENEPSQEARVANFPTIVNSVYEMLGLNSRGQSIRPGASSSQQTGGRGRGRNRNAASGNTQGGNQRQSRQSGVQGRQSQGGRGRGSNNNTNSRQEGNQNSSGYNLRPRTYNPQRYGGGQGRRWNENTDGNSQHVGNRRSDQRSSGSQSQPNSGARGDQPRRSGAGRGQGGNRNQTGNRAPPENRSFNTVSQTATRPAESTNNESTTSSTAPGSRDQGN
uniref:Gag polyprotein n=1 Tax=Simian foamy virus TaxID=11642 RepID=A0A6J3YL32_9RETR|nr:gag [Simian foamy virus]